ncbi:Activated RNA polymerase II transcriptional coactivator p15 [Habropoda laboriosa]|uniref:Activated RNA polymerase II transcriptional coactivator p15 n=1 Tax=Habropoda laboriosa TaxID=597456 RepID=A0A0L7RD83_9HYME|nr:PREDICTED: activated RNA polymerase II transcriptional coactivator p15 [Habropoda laboriosa]KOC68927.1 Activated RNA polymerase II transcriptional coactivator p15 [Habropoda laboriosa]
MPKSKEYVSSDDDSSEEEAKPKKVRKRETAEKEEDKVSKKPRQESNEDEDDTWDLGSNRKVTVKHLKGKLYVDIREMYYDKDANLKPGRKGICLNMSQWRKLLSVLEDVDKVVKSKS